MQLENLSQPMKPTVGASGHKFGLPELPIPARAHLKHRYDPVVHQVTNQLMQHGKLSVAQKVRLLAHLKWLIISLFFYH